MDTTLIQCLSPKRIPVAKNLIVIVADTLRCFESIPGFDWDTHAPYLSRLVPRLTTIRRLHATAPWTIPSHLSLLSGMDPWLVSLDSARLWHTIPKLTTLAESWGRQGGSSASFSANPVASERNGTLRGFDPHTPARVEVVPASAVLISSVIDEWVLCPSLRRSLDPATRSVPSGRGRELAAYACTRALDHYWRYPRMEQDLSRFLRHRDSARPLYLFFNLMEAHEPYLAESYSDGRSWDSGMSPTFSLSTLSREIERPPRIQSALYMQYLSAVLRLDRRIESIMRVLMKNGILESSAFVLVSDHGQSLGEHGFVGHGHSLEDELIRIPGYMGHFDSGRPRGLGFDVAQQLDLRHLYDLLVAGVESQDPGTLSLALEESLARRGRALAYWESIPYAGVLLKRVRGPKRRSLRVFSDTGSVALSQTGSEPAKMTAVAGSLTQIEAGDLSAVGISLLEKLRGFSSTGPPSRLEGVSSSLETWGYS